MNTLKKSFKKPIPYEVAKDGSYLVGIGNRNLSLIITFECKSPKTLMITGSDPYKQSTRYFNRRKDSSYGIFELEFPLPLCPRVLHINFWDKDTKSKDGIRILDISETDIKTGVITVANSEERYKYLKDFTAFAKKFAEKAGHLPLKHYISKCGKFEITYEDVIRDRQTGEKKRTPAVVYRKSGWIKIAANRFRSMTIPMRIIILYHEFFHHFWDSSDETKMDLSALNVYLAEGFPKSEGLYAFTNVFSDYEPLKQRANINNEYIKDYEYKDDRKNIKSYIDEFMYN